MKIKKNGVKIILDVGMAVLLILMYNKSVISLSFHELGGLFLCGFFVIHNLINARWIGAVSAKLFSKKIPIKTKIQYGVIFLLLICFVLIAISGFLISKKVFPALNTNSLFWKKFHFSLSAYAIALIGIHVGLHMSFIRNICTKLVKIPRRVTKPLYVTFVVFIIAAGFYNAWNSNFKRWIFIPFEQILSSTTFAPTAGTESDFEVHTGSGQGLGKQAKLFAQNDQNSQIGQSTVKRGSAQGFHLPPFSWLSLGSLLFTYGSIMALFTVLVEFLTRVAQLKINKFFV